MSDSLKVLVFGLLCAASWSVGATVTQVDRPVFRKGDRVAWIGDSITSNGHRTPHGYITTIERAAKATRTDGFGNIIGLGYGGWHVYSWHAYERKSLSHPELPSRLDRVPTLGDVFTNRLDVIVLALGINDHGFPTFPNDDLSIWEAEYDRFISDLRERCHPRQFVICNTTAHTCDAAAAANLRLLRMNRIIRAIAERHGAVHVDLHAAIWETIERVRRMKTGLRDLRDLIHPMEIGNAALARKFCLDVGEASMADWLGEELDRRYAALERTLGPRPRLVCQLRPDRRTNVPGARCLGYDIPWNLVGASSTNMTISVPNGWRGSLVALSPSNGVVRVEGRPDRLTNPIVLTAVVDGRDLVETVSIPAPWIVSQDFAFPDAWQGGSWRRDATPPFSPEGVSCWRVHTPTWDYAGDVDPAAIDLRAVNTGYPQGAAYVRRQLSVLRETKLNLVVGTTFWSANNGLRIWCDGRLVAETLLESGWKDGKPFSCADRTFLLRLSPGRHDLLILTANRMFDHYFHVRLVDAESGREPDGLRIGWTVGDDQGLPSRGVRRIVLPPRDSRGATGIVRLGPWDAAKWVWCEAEPLPPGGQFLRFRKEFNADGKTPLRFHVSADERFVLLLDGEVVARGPDRGDVNLWFVQSYEATLKAGNHCIEAVCWRMNPGQSPCAQLTWKGGFLFRAEGPYDNQLTTGKADWRVAHLKGTRMTRDKYPAGAVGAQCEVLGCGLESELPPDEAYLPVSIVRGAVPAHGGSQRVSGWLVYPSELPAQLCRPVTPGSFRAADDQTFDTNGVWFVIGRTWGSNAWYRASAATNPAVRAANALLHRGDRMMVPPRSRVRLLWDLGGYYCAYNSLTVSGGRGARIGWGWAESLYTGDCFDWHTVVTGKERKGTSSRAKWTDKYFYGNEDVFYPDGREHAMFTAPWWRCGRWCQVEIETADSPLEIEKIALNETRYPFEPQGYFECDDPTIDEVRALCLRGLQMCMHEMHFDCPYYEQQMYGGDTRLQMLTTAALTADDRLKRQAFRLFEISQRDNGCVSMNYPTVLLQESATFTFLWSLMLGDYALWHDDKAWLRARMPAVRRCLFCAEGLVDGDGLVRKLPGWSFVDWVPEWNLGVSPGGDYEGVGSSVNNLLYLAALCSAERVERAIGERELAERWRKRAEELRRSIVRAFWCESRGLLADTPAKDTFSEHAQSLAVLTGALSDEQEKRAFEGLVSDVDLARCTVSFSHYLFAAFLAKGRADLFLKRLDLWRDMVKQDLKTPLEGPGDARSDCHGWGAHPLYHLQTGVAGIAPVASGFSRVRIAPQPGGLRFIRAGVPSPRGLVREDLCFENGHARGTVTLPEGLGGVFVWDGRECPLKEGINKIETGEGD